MKKQTKIILIIFSVFVVLGLLIYGSSRMGTGATSLSFTYQGLDCTVSYSGIQNADNDARYEGLATNYNSNEVMSLHASVVDNGGLPPAQASYTCTTNNIDEIESIFIKTSASVDATEQGSASASITIKQEEKSLASAELSNPMFESDNKGSYPTGLLLEFGGGFMNVPTLLTSAPIDESKPIKLVFAVSAQTNANQRYGIADLDVESIMITQRDGPLPTTEKSNFIYYIIGGVILVLSGIAIYLWRR